MLSSDAGNKGFFSLREVEEGILIMPRIIGAIDGMSSVRV